MKEFVFGVIAIVANIALLNTLMSFIPFLSSLNLKENDKDDSTLRLFTVDVCLVLLFMAQHSLMATRVYKRIFTDLDCQPIARTIYVLATALVLQVLMEYWEPITEVKFWVVDTSKRPLLSTFFMLLHVLLWFAIILQALAMEPLYLLGIKQVYYYIQDWYPPTYYFPARFRTLIAHFPHPGAGCFVAVLWAHPVMTYDRMILATVLTAYLCCRYTVTQKDYAYVSNITVATREMRQVPRSYVQN